MIKGKVTVQLKDEDSESAIARTVPVSIPGRPLISDPAIISVALERASHVLDTEQEQTTLPT
jgi:hypothetical protein